MEGEFQAGRALGRGIGIWLKNLLPFILLSLFVYSPLIVYTALVFSGKPDLHGISVWQNVSVAANGLLSIVATAAMLYGVIENLSGKKVGVLDLVAVGLKRMLPVLGVGILSFLAIAVGFVCIIVPGVILACMLYVAVPAAVAERPGVMASLKRSQELTSGYKLQIFGIILVMFVLQFAAKYMLQNSILPAHPTMSDVHMLLIVGLAINIVLTSLSASVNGVVYHDLRVAKEGVATEDLARVFE